MKLILCCLVLIGLTASKSIPELYNLNNGVFTSDYSVTYTHSPYSGTQGVVSEAGDVNNDGIQDFMISDPLYDDGRGIVYVVYGKRGALRQFNTIDDFEPSDGFIIKGKAEQQNFGFAVSRAGDMNGDGVDDIIIGCDFWKKDDYTTKVGIVYVVYGRKDGDFPFTLYVDDLPQTEGFKIFGEGRGNHLGYALSEAGDMNGDGISDILLGAFGAGRGGKAYVIFGSKKGLADMQLPPANGKGFTVQATQQEDLGNTVRTIGDFNGDGIDDIILGAHIADGWRGRAYIIYGKKSGFPATISTPPSAKDGMMIQGVAGGDNFGCSVGGVGDFNGDGLQDAIIGAYAANGNTGGAYVIFGQRENPAILSADSLSPSRGFKLITNEYNVQFGLIATGGRDLNGDGLGDAIVSAPGLDQERGSVTVIYGAKKSSFSDVNVDSLTAKQGYTIIGNEIGVRFGSFVRPLRDVNNDGVNDLGVGTFTPNGGPAAYLFYIRRMRCTRKLRSEL